MEVELKGEWVELNFGDDYMIKIWIKCDSKITIVEKRKIALEKIKNKLKNYEINFTSK